MSKRTPGLQRNARDFYPTPEKAVRALVPHLPVFLDFYEPCAGGGALVRALEKLALVDCVGQSDIAAGKDASLLIEADIGNADLFITNPPWATELLHPILDNLVSLRPTWLLLYSDWLFTKQAIPYQPWIAQIVTMPRVRWMPDSKGNGKDNCCWILFDADNDRPFMTSGWD